MRQIVVDHARSRMAQKRGGDTKPLTLHESRVGSDDRVVDVLALNRALDALTSRSERLSQLVELHYFGGITFEETAEVLGLSRRTVHRDWRKARAFLYSELEGSPT